MNAHEQEHMWSTRYRSAGEDYVFGTTPNRFLAAQAALHDDGAHLADSRAMVRTARDFLRSVCAEIDLPVVSGEGNYLSRTSRNQTG